MMLTPAWETSSRMNSAPQSIRQHETISSSESGLTVGKTDSLLLSLLMSSTRKTLLIPSNDMEYLLKRCGVKTLTDAKNLLGIEIVVSEYLPTAECLPKGMTTGKLGAWFWLDPQSLSFSLCRWPEEGLDYL